MKGFKCELSNDSAIPEYYQYCMWKIIKDQVGFFQPYFSHLQGNKFCNAP